MDPAASDFEQRPPQQPPVSPGGSDCHVADMTATFSADLTLAAAQQILAAHEQWLPIDGDPDTSLGQLVEQNSTGPLRLGHGAWRDLLLGCQFLNGRGRGELITAGGRTVKNVAGYDLTKFMVGQRGIFGRLVTLTTRTYRRPPGALLATFSPEPQRLNELLPAPLRPQYAVLTPQSLFCGYLGDQQTLDFYHQQLSGSAQLEKRSLKDDIAWRAGIWPATRAPKGGGIAFRAALPPTSIMQFVREAQIETFVADPAFGIVLAGAESDSDARRLCKAAAAAGGSTTIWRADGSLIDTAIDPVQLAILRRLKQAFDPDNRLQPLPVIEA
jgi:FAD/FMN-containing dehydrogenase